MNKLKPNKTWIIYALVFAAYIFIGVFAGLHHEPWADEAQSWLIARDSHSLTDLLRAVKYEGTLPTWHLINKAFQLAGLDYAHLFVIPLIFSAIGVILLFFTDAPLLAKVMLPFSFFAVYQNAVVARQYSMVFPAMMLIVIFYKKRFEVPVRSHFVLFLLAITSSYGIVVTGSFMLWDSIGMVRKKFKDPVYKKSILPFCATGIAIVIMSFLSLPPEDCSMHLGKESFAKYATTALLFDLDSDLFRWIFLALMLVLFIYYFRNKLLQALVITAPLVIYMIVLYQRAWHMTYLFFLLVSLMIIFRDDYKKTSKHIEDIGNLLVSSIVVLLLAVQCFTGFYSVYYDYRNTYCPGREVAEFIKPYVESGETVDRLGFYAIAVSPYYDHSIYTNDPYGKAYYIWSTNAPNYVTTEEQPGVVVTYRNLEAYENPDYNIYRFDSHMIFKLADVEPQSYVVYVRKDIERPSQNV